MEHNNGNEVTVSEMKALLAELQDIDAEVETTSMGLPRGNINSGLKPTTQQSHSWQKHGFLSNIPKPLNSQILSKDEGNLSGQAVPEHKLSSIANVTNTPGFSTYTTTSGGGRGLSEQTKRHTPIPLGIRLAPIDSPGDNSNPDSQSIQKLSSYNSRLSPTALPGALNVLPPLSTGDAILTSPLTMQNPPTDTGKSPLRFHGSQPYVTETDKLAQELHHSVSADEKQHNSPPSDNYNYQANFLPIMCALHLTQVGLKPQPRWGHTLTVVDDEKLFMFGGMEATSAESCALMVFDTSSSEWGPVYLLNKSSATKMSSPPATRYHHAACAYEGHCLIIYGGAAVHDHLIYNDIYMYNTLTSSWKCLWQGPPSETDKGQGDGNNINSKKLKKNEPAARFGHSMVVREDRLYVFGGKVVDQEGVTTTNSTDVYVFSVSSCCWKKRIRLNKVTTCASPDTQSPRELNTTISGSTCLNEKAGKASNPENRIGELKSNSVRNTLCARAYHAATVKGDNMYINGGSGEDGNILSDTWQLNLRTGMWTCLHNGDTGGAIPRERHSVFTCGEAIMVIGGCSSSSQSASIVTRFAQFVSVLPLLGQATPCWIPVAIGNASIIAPNKKNFAAAFCGGFVYVFGGTCGSESSSNSMVRFLATDGYASEDGKDAVADGDESLRCMMQNIQEKGSFTVPYDVLSVADIAGGDTEEYENRDSEDTNRESLRGSPGGLDNRYQVGFHRVILQQRSPKFLDCLMACRSEFVVPATKKDTLSRRRLSQVQQPYNDDSIGGDNEMSGGASSEAGDAVDALLLQNNTQYKGPSHCVSATGCSTDGVPNDPTAGGMTPVVPNGIVYYVQGNKRVKGLPHPLTAEELRCLANYIYWGGLKAKFRILLKDDDDDGARTKGASVDVTERQRLRSILISLRTAADDYDLEPLRELTDALLEGDRHRLHEARQHSACALRNDMLQLLNLGKGATVTVLFVDPHTKQKKAHALHPVVLASSSNFFEQLLRPLFKEGRTKTNVDGVVAKLSGSDASILRKRLQQEEQGNYTGPTDAQLTSKANPLSSSKTSIVLGPLSVPFPAIQILLRYLYTKQLHVPQQLALETMMGAHQLRLSLFRAHCEAIVGRSDVNYKSCCSFYFLSKRYNASLLQEMALLTAVSGYSKVRSEAAFRDLPEECRKVIDTVSMELGSDTWVPPQKPGQEIKPFNEYTSRWNAISHS
ncbi:unnamed protein product [Phytomonas sp. Hart1]|nr:unnamed protein product [Phytomonas sp. Hart1]|eukprot:CCW66302.1 unnamed protein product [Phytomonas sp. isolate Hart1]